MHQKATRYEWRLNAHSVGPVIRDELLQSSLQQRWQALQVRCRHNEGDISLRAWLIAIGLILFPANLAAAQTVPKDTLRSAVAIVVARGVNETDSSPVESVGTGFFINSMGLLVTSYHLREDLGAAVNTGSVKYEVHFDQFSGAVPAKNIYDSPEADILILYVPVSGRVINVLKPADPKSAKLEIAKTPVYAASFAAGYDFSLTPAVITSWSGPVRPLVPATGRRRRPGEHA